MDLGAAAEIEKRDLSTASQAVKSQFENVSSTIGERFTPAILDASKGLSEFLANTQRQLASQPQFGPELGESAALIGPRNPIAPLKGAWRTFLDNSRGQLSTPLGGDIPESAAMPRSSLDLAGLRSIPAGPHKFGLGAGGVGSNFANIAATAAALRMGPIEARAKLDGSARVENRLEIGLSPGLELVRKDSNVRADGALRSDTGITMPMDR